MPNKKEVVEFLYKTPAKIGQAVGFGDFTDLHNNWIRKFVFSEEDYTLQAHRGSYKSTCLSIANALYMLLYPQKNTILLRKTDNDVIESIKQTKKVLESTIVQSIARILYNNKPLILTEVTAFKISTNLYHSPRGASQLLGLGIGSSITGKHADRIITDDIININDRISKAERERTKIAYMELNNICNRGGNIVNIGTPWHKDDAFTLMPEPEKHDCYSTGLISDKQLKKIQQSMSASLYSANYELRHIASEDIIFDGIPQYTSDINLLYNGIAHIDASYGGADSTAFTIARRIGNKIYAYGRVYDKHIDKCIGEIVGLIKVFRAGTIYCEKNADKGYLAKEFRRLGYPVNNYNENMNKFLKISSYLKKWWHDIIFLNGTDKAYIENIQEYNEQAEHDDPADSLACICRILDKNDFRGI